MVNYCTSCNNWNIHRHCSLDFAGGRQGTQWCHTKINTSKTMLLVDIHSSLFFLTLLWSFLPAFVVSATATLNPLLSGSGDAPLVSAAAQTCWPQPPSSPIQIWWRHCHLHCLPHCHNAKYSGSPSVFNERRGK
jgi:hypothetical protein